ncbi:nucleoside recognition domain-containing protein [Ferrimonas balearica]|uniref:nucleoside recognition domain-containing protein n=1 Tax=Ferrimonas balearica TaxID=44012 RepID=UPI001C5A0AA4|nr:spore maturation protein [Ferrimonas balearica]MBY6223378.1 spore maturation protein [Ferrimonas balearica]
MLNRVWGGFFLLSGLAALMQWYGGNDAIFATLIEQVMSMAKLAVEIAIGLAGIMALWMGLLKIAEHSGLTDKLARWLSPLLHRLMPEVPKGDPAFGAITMNLSANVLGLDNAATPMGLRAMKALQRLNPTPDTASNAQILFLVLNTSSVTLFPIAVLLYRAQQGAANPAEVFVPILLATTASTLAGLLCVAAVQRINLLNRVVLLWAAAIVGLLMALLATVAGYSAQQLQGFSVFWGNAALCAFIGIILASGYWRGVAVFDRFVEGAKEGFHTTVSIAPYLLAMLVAIGALRGSGALELFLGGIRSVVLVLGWDGRFVDALPTALMKPFSGSGARAMMLETMSSHGVDSFAGRLAALFQGSTETTFYVLAVYFGGVGIRHTRHAIPCGLAADLAGILAAIAVAYWFFG